MTNEKILKSQVLNTINPMDVDKVKDQLCDSCKLTVVGLFERLGKTVLLNPNAFAKGFYKALCADCKGRVLKVIKK